MSRPHIFVFADYYLPGYKAGGPIASLSNIVKLLGDEFEFFIFTRDRDAGENQPYSEVKCSEWVRVGKAKVLYSTDLSLRFIRRRLIEISPNVIYLNSFFSALTVKTLLLRRLGLLPPVEIVLAPRGEFSLGALELKSIRKWCYRKAASLFGTSSGVIWHASSELEREQIERALQKDRTKRCCIEIATDLPDIDILYSGAHAEKPEKLPGAAKFLFLSRISPMKNLTFALDMLGRINGQLELDIYGPADDKAHWEKCQRRIQAVPGNVTVRYHGAVPSSQAVQLAALYHFFILPSQGESFGHAILEALAAGCPVILSDRTPWRDVLEAGAGWCLSLEAAEEWRAVMQSCADMNAEIYRTHSLQARRYFESWCRQTVESNNTAKLFHFALSRAASVSVPLDKSVSAASSARV
ncbi:MAG: glycosyltransferase family 4 protein [Candidatus Acidiferrales bacterium]